MRSILRRRFAIAAITGLVVVALGTSAVLGAVVATNGGPVTAVLTKTVVHASDVRYGHSPITADVPGMSLSVAVPANQLAIFVITFSAETTCHGTTPHASCYIRVLFDGSAVNPGVLQFNITDDVPEYQNWTAKSMQFVAGPAGPGTHLVRVQFVSSANTYFGFDARTLTVLRSQV